MPKRFWLFWLVAFLLALAFDFLFWMKTPGISIPIWITLVLIGGIVLIRTEGRKPHWRNIILIVAAIGMAFVTAFRSEPFTRFFALMLTFAALFILGYSYLKGFWVWYRLQDHLTSFFRLLAAMFSRGFRSNHSQGESTPIPATDRHKIARLFGRSSAA